MQLKARPVTIKRFDILEVRRPEGGRTMDVDVVVECTSGTYIRALARDLGEALGVGGHLTALRRTRVGSFGLDTARTLDQLAEEFAMVDLATSARNLFPARELSAEETAELGYGRRIEPSTGQELTAAFSPEGELISLVENVNGKAKPALVFAAN